MIIVDEVSRALGKPDLAGYECAFHSGTIEAWVKEFNGAAKKIFVSLYNTSANRILSGARGDLIAFHERYKAEFEAKQIKFVYLRSTCPFHCELMTPILEKFK